MRGNQLRGMFTVQLPFKIKKDGDWYVSCCPVLDVYSQGKTENKAIENLREAISLFLMSCFEAGTLEQVLKECGFQIDTITSGNVQPRARRNTLDVQIPFRLPVSQGLCHA